MKITKENIFLELVKNLTLNNSFYNKKDFITLSKVNNKQKILNMFTDINELEKYYKLNKLQILKLLYHNRASINSILYDLQSNITLDSGGVIQNLSYYFYASLLIEDFPSITNYIYSIKYIKELNEQIKKINDDKIKDLYIKIILVLIENYEQADIKEPEEVEEKEDEIEKIKTTFDKFNYKSKKIDGFYTEIILFLIKKKKLEDYDYSYSIIKQIDLESIDITDSMYKEIFAILDSKSIYMKDYLILTEKDLFNYKIINFYYILIKYILKDSIFIYQIDLLLKVRKFILEMIKSKPDIIKTNYVGGLDNNIKERFKYFIEKIFDSEYYSQKYFNLRNENGNCNNVININNENDVENDNENGNGNNVIIINNDNDIENDNENENENEHNIYQNNENDENNDQSLVAEECPSSSNNNNSESENNSRVSNDASSSNRNKSNPSTSEDKSLISKQSSVINKFRQKKISLPNNPDFSNVIKAVPSSSSEISNSNININENNEYFKIKEYKIMSYINTIGKHNKKNKDKKNDTADLIIDIKGGFLSRGTNSFIYIYNLSYNKISDIQIIPYFAFSICEISLQNKIYTIIPFKESLSCYIISKEYKKKNTLEKEIPLDNSEILFLIKLSTNDYFACFKDHIKYIKNLFYDNLNNGYNKIYVPSVKCGIKINDNYVVFKSCDIKNPYLQFYNCFSQKLVPNSQIKGYSLIYSTNGLSIMPREENNPSNIILLCACKKYIKKQKNGILLVNLKYSKNQLKISSTVFCDTKKFEVFCFCPILIKENDPILLNQCIMKDSNYFLVGGFNPYRNTGVIKLYKVIYLENHSDTKIEYLQDIFIEQKVKNDKILFHNFKGPISSMLQSKTDGNILITSWDGNVYLFSYPNIEYYLKEDENIEKNILS